MHRFYTINMLIGEDFDKIEFQFLGLDLVEPNALIGDLIICVLSIYFAIKISKLQTTTFFKNWKYFFIAFSIGFFAGGMGHIFFNYWGVPGKYMSWFFGIISVFFIEKGMISIHSNINFRNRLQTLITLKLILAVLLELLVISFVNLDDDPSIGMRVVTINSTIGLIFCLGYLGYYYARTITPAFRNLIYSVLIMFPSAILVSMKISFHQWFDRNDASHVLLAVGLFFYYAAIKGYSNYLNQPITEK